jgi:FKBP-type peptidyl-prolyl cis-trans isomerase SlyD
VIEEGKQVSIEYTLKLDDGSTADSNVDGDPLTYEQGGGQILPALEKALAGMEVDETREVKLSPAEGYGEVNPEARQSVPLTALPEDARKEGTVLVAQDNSGNQQMVRVHQVGDESAVLDFNHPLAGQSLHFEVKVLGIE